MSNILIPPSGLKQPLRGIIEVDRSNYLSGYLVGAFPMNEAGGQFCYDATGRRNKINLVGAGWNASPYGTATRFSGTTSYGVTNNKLQVSRYNKMSLSFWMWWDAFADDNKLGIVSFNRNDATGGATWICTPNRSANSRFEFGTRGDAGYSVGEFTRPTAQRWHHYVLIVDMSETANEAVAAYVDGVQQVITITANNNNTGTFRDDVYYFMTDEGLASFGAGQMHNVLFFGGLVLTKAMAIDLYKYPYLIYRQKPTRFYSVPQAAVSTVKFRKTLAPLGTGVGKRQLRGW